MYKKCLLAICSGGSLLQRGQRRPILPSCSASSQERVRTCTPLEHPQNWWFICVCVTFVSFNCWQETLTHTRVCMHAQTQWQIKFDYLQWAYFSVCIPVCVRELTVRVPIYWCLKSSGLTASTVPFEGVFTYTHIDWPAVSLCHCALMSLLFPSHWLYLHFSLFV